jgi:hypothetical protein
MRPGFAVIFRPRKGVGNAGRPMHPQPGGQKRVDSRTSSSHHEFTGKHPAFPHAMVYGLFRALPGDQDLVDTVIGG